MNPLGGNSRAFSWPCAALRPCLLQPAGGSGGGGRRGRVLRGLLGAGTGAAAAGLSSLAARSGGLLPLAAAGMAPRAGGRSSSRGEFGDPDRRLTDVLLVTNILMFGLQLATNQMATVWGMKVNQLIAAGQWWRFVTPAFLHGGIMHLVVNSYSLNNLGPAVENSVGRPRFLLMYLAAAVASTAASVYGSPNPSLGASGAIFGLGGALAVYFYRNRNIFGKTSDAVLRRLWQTLLMNAAYSMFTPRLDNWGHMGGLVGGALAAALLGPQLRVVTLPGKRGKWLVDNAPLPFLRDKPRPISGGVLGR